MESLIIFILVVITIVILKLMLGSNKKIIMKIANNEKLNNIVQKLPENIDICKVILKKLRNEKVKIEEQENTNCFYFIATDKIILNKDKKYFTRVQTIAHECIHSIQDKKILWFNYIFANLLNIFWLITIVLTIAGVITQYALFSAIILICIIIFYAIRSYLEIEAMTKAKYIAKEYLEEKQVKETIENAITLYRSNGEILNLTINEYLIGAVAGEMPASFNIEALKELKLKIEDYSKNADLRAKIRDYYETMSDYIRLKGFPIFIHDRIFL